jgi:hypothetical protein
VEFWAKLLARAIVMAMSIAEASTLRNRLFETKNEHEVMWTALDDIARMYKDHPSGQMARRILDKIPVKYGR